MLQSFASWQPDYTIRAAIACAKRWKQSRPPPSIFVPAFSFPPFLWPPQRMLVTTDKFSPLFLSISTSSLHCWSWLMGHPVLENQHRRMEQEQRSFWIHRDLKLWSPNHFIVVKWIRVSHLKMSSWLELTPKSLSQFMLTQHKLTQCM